MIVVFAKSHQSAWNQPQQCVLVVRPLNMQTIFRFKNLLNAITFHPLASWLARNLCALRAGQTRPWSALVGPTDFEKIVSQADVPKLPCTVSAVSSCGSVSVRLSVVSEDGVVPSQRNRKARKGLTNLASHRITHRLAYSLGKVLTLAVAEFRIHFASVSTLDIYCSPAFNIAREKLCA